jgi:hypothetical protein
MMVGGELHFNLYTIQHLSENVNVVQFALLIICIDPIVLKLTGSRPSPVLTFHEAVSEHSQHWQMIETRRVQAQRIKSKAYTVCQWNLKAMTEATRQVTGIGHVPVWLGTITVIQIRFSSAG